MYKLREQRLKEFYTTGEMIQTETTSKRSSTRTHTESITDQGFITMKTKEIRDSESPTEDYQRHSNTNKNYYVSSKNDESDDNKGTVQMEVTNLIKPSEEFIQSSLQTTRSSSSSKWESSRTIITESEEIQKADINLSSKFIVNEQNNKDRQLKYDTTLNDQSTSNNDIKVTETITNIENIKQDDNNQNSNGYKKVIESHNTTSESNDNLFEPISNKNDNHMNNISTLSDNLKNKVEIIETTTDNKIINELQKLDSYLSTQRSTTDSSTKSNSTMFNEEENIKNIDDQSAESLKENVEDQYTTTYQNSYQQPRISVDLSPSHEAFARSLRSTPERSSPSPGRERASPERRFKSMSPEKYRASPEKSESPSKSLKSFPRRKLSSTHTKDISKKRSNTPTRGAKYDSSDDSDCSGVTHGTYDKYKSYDAKRTLFKEEIKNTSKYSQKSPSTSPSRREKSPGYSSEGSVAKEVRKSTSKAKNSSHESSPERSAFKPIRNYRTPKIQDSKINHMTREENIYTNTSKNNITDINNFDKIENNLYTNQNVHPIKQNNDLGTKNKTIHEKFIVEEQFISSEQVDNKNKTNEIITNTEIKKTNREKSPSKNLKKENKLNQDEFVENEKLNIVKENTKFNDVVTVKSKEKSPSKEGEPVAKYTSNQSIKTAEKISHSTNDKIITSSKKTTSAIPSSVKKTIPMSIEKTPSKKSLIQKDSKDNLLHKTVKKDLSREKVDIKITKSDSKNLIHKNSKDNITSKVILKKPSQEMLIDKKTTISSRNKISSPETKPTTQESIKVIEKKDSKNKLKPSISPQSSQKKFGVVKSPIESKTISDYKKNTECTNLKKTPTNTIKSKTFNSAKLHANETAILSKGIKTNSKVVSTSIATKPQINKTTSSSLNKIIKIEVTKSAELKSKDLEDELPPDNFESDTDLENSSENPKYIKNKSSNSSSSSSSSSDDEDGEDKQKIKELDNIRIEAEEEYGNKMTNKDVLLNVTVRLPVSSRESSPEYSERFNQPFCSVSDDTSSPRYADVVSEPEDVNDYRLNSSRYDIVTDLDEETNVTVADRVSKFLNNANKQDELKTTEIPQSPQAVRKTKQIFESIAKGEIEKIDVHEDDSDINESEIKNTKIHNSSKNTTNQTFITRKISGASDYKTRKEFFENKKLNDAPNKLAPSTSHKITRTSSIKDRRASFEAKSDKKTPLKDKTNAPRTRSPESKNSSPDRFTKNPININETEILDVKIEENNKSKKLSGTKIVKDRTSTFENNEVIKKSTKENKTTPIHHSPISVFNTGKITEPHTKSTISDTNNSANSTKRVTSPNRSKKSPDKTTSFNSISKVNENSNSNVSSKSTDRKITETHDKNNAKCSDKNVLMSNKEENSGNHVHDKIILSKQRTSTITKNEFGATVKNASAPKTTLTTTKLTSVNNIDDEIQIEEIFDLDVLEIMVNVKLFKCIYILKYNSELLIYLKHV